MAHNAEVNAQEGPQPTGEAMHAAQTEAPPGPPPAGAEAPAPGAPSFALMAGGSVLALVFGMIGACLSLNLFENSSQAASPGAPPTRSERPAPTELKALRTQVEALTQRVDGLKDRLDALPKAEPSSGLTTLQVQVADLTKAAREAAPLPSQIDRVNQQLGQLSHEIVSLRREIGDVQLRLGKAEPAPAPARVSLPEASKPAAPTPELEPEDDSVQYDAKPAEAPEWRQAVSLFKNGKYKEALELFNALELAQPDDARVWYYAALSRGFATNQWTGGTEDLAAKGVEREKAGTPEPADIDRTFRTLTTATGKEWLAAYRARAKGE